LGYEKTNTKTDRELKERKGEQKAFQKKKLLLGGKKRTLRRKEEKGSRKREERKLSVD